MQPSDQAEQQDTNVTKQPLLQLREFGTGFADRIILSSVDLDIYPTQITCLMGPTGVGKSTLLRTLAGFNEANPNFRTWGTAIYCGETLGSGGRRPRMVQQSTRLLMSSLLENLIHDLPERSSLTVAQQRDLATRMLEEAGIGHLADNLSTSVIDQPLAIQRLIAIIRLCATGTRLLCLDEPTSGLSSNDESLVLDYIALQGKRRSILISLHNQQHARRLGGRTALLAGGRIQEEADTPAFFTTPETTVAQKYVATGSCAVPAPDTPPEALADDVPPPPPLPEAARSYVSESFGPRGFLWLIKGVLAGTPMPGIFFDSDYDLKALQRVGIRHLVCLLEQAPPIEENDRYGISTHWCPIPDMDAPTPQQALDLCQHIYRHLSTNEAVAVHCRAGMGRTGTILATYLIWQGLDAFSALETVRNIEPRWVQSQKQVDFLEAYEDYLSRIHAR
ncbi:ATP-binding cassette domain-containing protein [Parathalassolituus penaei]|uniref:ATP-binding cassette domain-containing protein n=1 Tax=Parathalassolituus penaei TaxID=2997323 RepID=A0A9X3EBJ1_9GAMM|nr:ATP-binding cassette domain-containing protein [Parathalassolituus penaei]MCY0964529.1 ATP-binding cassette domain-containing protein [Parathalassolituus penaei]